MLLFAYGMVGFVCTNICLEVHNAVTIDQEFEWPWQREEIRFGIVTGGLGASPVVLDMKLWTRENLVTRRNGTDLTLFSMQTRKYSTCTILTKTGHILVKLPNVIFHENTFVKHLSVADNL
jgi:hypothetical protein